MLNSLSVLSPPWGPPALREGQTKMSFGEGLKIYQLENKFIFLFYISNPSPITVRLTFLLLITVGFNRRIELTKIRALAQYFWCRAKAQFFLIS